MTEAAPPSLGELGLAPGDRVRFRRHAGQHWHHGVVWRREPDGSLGLYDDKGAARAIPVHRVQAEGRGPLGGRRWTTLPEPVPAPLAPARPVPAAGPARSPEQMTLELGSH